MKTKTNPAPKLRKLADGLQKQIDAKKAPRLANTPKRQREAQSAYIEGERLQRVQTAMRKLADAHDAGTIPPNLAELTSKVALLPLLSRRLDHHSYYSISESNEWSINSPIAVELRDFLDGKKTQEEADREAERTRQAEIARLEQKLKFSDIPGFFPTPENIVAMMLDYANIQDGETVLEPSAGKGDIAEAILNAGDVTLTCIEQHYSLCDVLTAKGLSVVRGDFLEHRGDYDKIVMNPPFENGQDIDHVRHAYTLLNEGGRLVAVMSSGSFTRSDKKGTAFREWMSEVSSEVIDLPDGSFKTAFRSTGVSCKLLVVYN